MRTSNRFIKTVRSRSGFTLVELLFATAVSSLVLGAAAIGVMTLQKSFFGSKHYARGMNDGTRLVDYISRDLRNALKVSRRTAGIAAPFKVGSFEVTDSDQLVVFLPDYFVSNIPDNSSGSDYKLPRFSRSRLPLGQEWFSYNDVVEVIGTKRGPKYPSLLEVRYVKKARSAQDPTICYFRQEYEGGTLRAERDIAENVDSARLTVQAVLPRSFRILSSFASKWSFEAARAGTRQFSTVQLLNQRRD